LKKQRKKHRVRVKLVPADTQRRRINEQGEEEVLKPALCGGLKGKNKIFAMTPDGTIIRVPYIEAGYIDTVELKKKQAQQT
jgi:hypothetical protein